MPTNPRLRSVTLPATTDPIQITVRELHDRMQHPTARQGYYSILAAGDVTFSLEGCLIEGTNLVDELFAVVRHPANAFFVCLTVHIGLGIASHGMSALILDFDDVVTVKFERR